MSYNNLYDKPYICAYEGCRNEATGKCEGHQKCLCAGDNDEAFLNDCGQYFCRDHLHWGWGIFCVNGCIAAPQCPKHHTGISCCVIL